MNDDIVVHYGHRHKPVEEGEIIVVSQAFSHLGSKIEIGTIFAVVSVTTIVGQHGAGSQDIDIFGCIDGKDVLINWRSTVASIWRFFKRPDESSESRS